MKILLIGFGDLAQRLAPQLQAAGDTVSALRRSPAAVPGVELFRGDCRDPALLAETIRGQHGVVVTLSPASFTEEGYRETYVAAAQALAEVLGQLPPRVRPQWLLWVSSTSVYGEGSGEWVSEVTPAQPQSFAGRCLREAETIVASLPVATTVVRFSGIYGPGRTRLIDQVRAGFCAPAQPEQWSNRIHSDDCAGVLRHLIERRQSHRSLAPVYLASDCSPVPLHQVHRWLAQQMGVESLAETPAGRFRGNRRCDNRRLLATGYQFLYPTWQDGYQALLASTEVKARD